MLQYACLIFLGGFGNGKQKDLRRLHQPRQRGVLHDVPIYGEVHGGATPEEALVPIIVFDSNKPIPIRASWKRNKVKIKNKMVKAILVFNQTVKKLEVKIGANNANTIPSQDGKEWTVLFSGIKEGQYKVNVVADNSFTAIEDLQVLSALGNQHGGIF